MTFHIRALITALLLLLTAQSCTFIDDDRSDCEDTYSLNYELKVVSNINLQLSEQLQVSTGSMTLKALNNYFSPIMQPATSEARQGFFPTDGDAPIYYSLHTEGRRTALGISIPADNYRHIAVIGQADPSIFLTDTTMAATVRLTQFLNDTVDSHNHAILSFLPIWPRVSRPTTVRGTGTITVSYAPTPLMSRARTPWPIVASPSLRERILRSPRSGVGE